MFTVGPGEMLVIFLVAMLLFGPKKLPGLARTIGKAIAEFRRASNHVKYTFEQQMQFLERESESLKQITPHDSTAATPPTVSASETPGAESR